MDALRQAAAARRLAYIRSAMLLSALLCLVYLAVDARHPRATEAMAWRVSWILVLAAGALLQRPAWPRLSRLAAHLVALWSGIAAVMILRAAGGTSGPVFGFLMALPLAVLVLAPDYPWAGALTGLATSLGGVVTLLEEGRGGGEAGEWALLTGALTVLAVAGSIGFRRTWTAEVAARGERRLALERLAEADRLALAGQLASGVAHEINSPLSYVTANLRFAREALPGLLPAGDPAAQESLEALAEASTGAERIARLVKDLKILGSGPVAEEPERLDLVRVVQAAVRIAGTSLRGRATVATDLADAPPALGSESRVAQVVVHLVALAADASPSPEPALTVRTRRRGDRAAIEVLGDGAPPDAGPDGTGESGGLGLWICRAAVREVGGTLEVERLPGGGALLRVLLRTA